MLRLLILLIVSGWTVEAFLPRFPVSVANKFGLNTIHDPETDRIVGGETALPGEFLYQASLQRIKKNGDLSHFCGASVFNSNCVVTAGHCCSTAASKLRVYVGSQLLKGEGSYHDVAEVVRHKNYNPSSIDHDIGIMKLKTPINISDSVQPVELNEDGNLASGTECVCSGWGTTAEGGIIPTQLRKVTVPIISKAECKKYYGKSEITDSMICAGYAEGGKDSCQGDSGGPLVLDSKLVGVVSWGYGCARPNYPGVYTDISLFRDWIKSNCA